MQIFIGMESLLDKNFVVFLVELRVCYADAAVRRYQIYGGDASDAAWVLAVQDVSECIK